MLICKIAKTFVILILLRLFVNKLSEENECVNVAVHCNCMAEENFHFTEALKI